MAPRTTSGGAALAVRFEGTDYPITAAGLLIGLWLWRRGTKPHGVGSIVGQYLILTGIARFLVEFVRRNPKIVWGLSNAQLASVGSFLAGIALVWWAATRPVTESNESAIAIEKTA